MRLPIFSFCAPPAVKKGKEAKDEALGARSMPEDGSGTCGWAHKVLEEGSTPVDAQEWVSDCEKCWGKVCARD